MSEDYLIRLNCLSVNFLFWYNYNGCYIERQRLDACDYISDLCRIFLLKEISDVGFGSFLENLI